VGEEVVDVVVAAVAKRGGVFSLKVLVYAAFSD
jgi:hypothetical protein